MRLLVLRGGALGDFLVTLPALHALRTRWPEARVTLIGNARAAELGRLAGCVDEVHDQQAARWAPLGADAPWPPELAAWLGRFDRVINYWPDADGTLARQFEAWGPRYLAASAAQVTARPAARHFLAPLEAAGWAEGGELTPQLPLPADLRQAAVARCGGACPAVAIHPGSGSPRKTWPLARWHDVARALGRPVLWISGPADGPLPPPDGVPVVAAHEWPLPLLAAALAQTTYYLGHDTGISHLAAAAGARGWLLFGPTDPAVWAPPTARLQVIAAPAGRLDHLSADDVLPLLTRAFDAS